MEVLSPYPYDTHFVEPEPCGYAPGDEPPNGDVLTQAQVQGFLERGYVFLDGLWPADLIDKAAAEMSHVYPQPTPGDVEHASRLRALPPLGRARGDFRSECETGFRGRDCTFPAPSCPGFNAVTTHPRLWKMLGQILGAEEHELRLAESLTVGKCASGAPPPPPPPPPLTLEGGLCRWGGRAGAALGRGRAGDGGSAPPPGHLRRHDAPADPVRLVPAIPSRPRR